MTAAVRNHTTNNSMKGQGKFTNLQYGLQEMTETPYLKSQPRLQTDHLRRVALLSLVTKRQPANAAGMAFFQSHALWSGSGLRVEGRLCLRQVTHQGLK